MLSDFWSVYLIGFGVVMLLFTMVWAISVKLINASIVDPFWGLGFVLLSVYYHFNSAGDPSRKLIVLIASSLWGLRLFGYLFWRNVGKPEDYRYAQFRLHYGVERYWWFSFFQVFLLQGLLLWMISSPLLTAQYFGVSKPIGLLDFTAIFFWTVGFLFEAGGDYQLVKFKANPSNKGKVLDTGFWRFTRHPNYFGDACVWWGFALFSIAIEIYWPILSSVLMTFLLLKVSGVSLLERALKKHKPEYEEYSRKTPSFFPWFPKN
jgi:steroid 5-alpha reductase family enzyme